ncbi:porin [Paraburkholderia sp. Tr-20389]|uniref:porin n=1 Tax=Paraburkholderia sp. Tr-20389 TaxID=2703903 RepID=UPI00197EFB0C|nr:porin [Paraburkholderia sp. Tr-20389]
MKKTGISALVLSMMGMFAAAAHAQGSATLYGIIDEGFNYNSNMKGSRSYALQSGVMQGSRWGLRGLEDLGGGLKTIFVLESGFDVNNGKAGQGGLLFGRQAFVGVTSDRIGSFTLGRQYDVDADFVGPFEAGTQWSGNVGAHPGDLDNFNNTVRTNNSIKFKSLSYAGFSFGAMYSLGGVAGDVTRNQAWSVGAGYTNGPLALGVGYMNVRNPNVSFFGNATTGTPSASTSNVTYPIYSGFMSARTYQVIGAGGAYTLGAATLGFTYSNVAFKDLGDLSSGPNPSRYAGSVHFNNAEANFKYQVTPALIVGVAYDYTNSSKISSGSGTNNGATYHQGMLGVDYFLSKRTDVYVMGIYQKASGTDSRNQSAIASINNQSSPSSNDRQALVRVGIRHKF